MVYLEVIYNKIRTITGIDNQYFDFYNIVSLDSFFGAVILYGAQFGNSNRQQKSSKEDRRRKKTRKKVVKTKKMQKQL